jgi:hypothetical protein
MSGVLQLFAGGRPSPSGIWKILHFNGSTRSYFRTFNIQELLLHNQRSGGFTMNEILLQNG